MRRYLRECGAGDWIEDVFLICDKAIAPTSTGKQFIKASLCDRTMSINARIWGATREMFDTIPDSGVIRVKGRIENYQGNLQFIIEALWPANEADVKLEELMPATKKNIDEMFGQVKGLIESIQNRHVKAICQAYLDDAELMKLFRKAPAAKTMHHAFVGGLLEHTLSAMGVGNAVVGFWPGVNRDLVLAGIFIHDLAKTWELTYDASFGYSDGGNLIGHVVKGAIWVEKYAAVASQMLNEKIPQSLVEVLQHIVLSHHGVPEFGAPKKPLTPEAHLVHVVENLDAKMNTLVHLTRGDGKPVSGNWTDWIKAHDGRLYCPDVAPADAGDGVALEIEATVKVVEPKPMATLKLQLNNPLFENVNGRK